MTGNKKTNKNSGISQQLKALEAEKKRLRKKQRDLLKRSGKSIREFRSEIAALKRAGVIPKRTDARRVEPTKHFRAKVRKFYDVLAGTKLAVKAPPAVRKKYTEKGLFEERGAFLIVNRENARQKSRISKGLLKTTKPLGKTKINEVILPYNATDMLDLANRMENDPNILSELDGADQYAFSLFGHNSQIGFPNKSELVEYIKVRYTHLFKGRNGKQAVQHFKLITFSGGRSEPPPNNEAKFFSQRESGRRSENKWITDKRNKVRAARDRKRRAALTGAALEEYKKKGRERAAKSYAAKKAKGLA